MSTKVVAYTDLRTTIDNNPPRYHYVSKKRSFSDGEKVRHFDLSTSTESSVEPSRQSSRQDSRAASRNSGASKSKGKSKNKQDGRENSDVAETESKYKRSKSTLETVDETDVFDNVYDLKDEESWAGIPAPDVHGRFRQYRKLTQSHVAELEDKLQVTLARMNRKVQTLKGQFQEHKTKWDTERNILLSQVNQAQDLQKDAEQEADTTITQLENFITEQEKLEIEEARKRQEMAMSINSLNKVVPGTSHSSDDDIQKLMQQTDDAKALASTVGEDILIDDKTINNKESLSPGSNLPPIQQYVIKNLKAMMADPEDKLPAYQQKILETVRLALRVLNDTKVELAEEELLRSVSVVSLASQLTHEAMQLGVRPDSLFKTLASVSRRLLEEKELELRHLLDSTVDDGFSEISFESGTEGEHSLASLRDLPILEDVSDKDVQTDKTPLSDVEIIEEQMTPAVDAEQRTLQQEGTFIKEEEAVVDKGSSPISISSARSTTESKEHDDDTADDTADTEDSVDVEDIETADPQSSNQDENLDERKSLLKSSAVSDRSYTTNSPVSDISEYRNQQSRGSQTDSSFTPSSKQNVIIVKIPDDGTDSDLRLSSAKSRQSLRSTYKTKIEESKKMAEDRKHKSAALKESIQEVKDSEEKFDEDQEDYLKGFGFSATGELLPEHPVVQEYIKTYNMGMGFKDALAKTLLDKDMMSASQVISDIEVHRFRHKSKVLPQLEKMTKSLSTVLGEIITLLNGILVNDRDPAVSSVMFVSRDATMITPDSSRTPLPTGESQVNLDNVDNDYVRDLQEKCNLLHKNLEESTKKHEDQLRHNTVVMMGMQETINGLQRELSTLGKAPRSRSITPSFPLNQAPSPDTSIMFTRLDAERNAKIMKKAVNDEKLDQNIYKEAVSQMDKYISLPAQRLGHLVRKYIHHNRMKYIEENIQKNVNLDDGVFEVLDKMEGLQNERAKRWAEKMDSMGSERLRMANLLMETLDSIENESGIFLIKPMYSYRSRDLQQKYNGKLSRPIKSRKAKSAVGLIDNQSTQGPVNTPASNVRNIHREITLQSRESTYQVPVINKRAFEGPDGIGLSGTGVAGAAGNWVGNSSTATWNVNLSQSRPSKDDSSNFHNTPRILELDINRMLIGQNNISTRLSYPLTDDRLTNATQNTLRTYVTVNRPAVQPKTPGLKDSSAPPSTPQPVAISAGNGVRNIDNSPPKLPSTPPLPPINTNRNLSASSSRQSPTSEMKPKRITSGFTATTSDDD
ncbi:hypothetical protein LOTGIDRAFT_234110 [Lottia gigantea]|uniref:Uncharacterized protein n=1 Tax=Lottia gigantea TaxID=225164 RepID=V4A8S4_LOTGI|nr:hypothetical protein LOTGIDRAFT_234110 [Lottia gigantea]ESO89706.1 hypothetical protein LOTGIDRAFT_234110 [Lottia gigantea]